MAYIYLEELKKILPGILDQWIDKDDEGWEWIFQEIEQKCHVGKKKKDKKPNKKDMQNAMEIAIMAHRNDINELNKKFDEIKFNDIKKVKEDIAFLITKMRVISGEVEEAKFAAQTAKQRTEVDYSKYSGKSDGKVSYSKEAKKLNEELNSMTSDDIAKWCKEQDSKNLQSCTTCKHYCGDGVIKEPCIGCEDYYCWEAKDE